MSNRFSKWAKEQGLKKEEFIEEVMTNAAVIGAFLLDKNGTPDDACSFSIYDKKTGETVKVTINRESEKQCSLLN